MGKKLIFALTLLLLISCSSKDDSSGGGKVEMKITSVTVDSQGRELSSPFGQNSEMGVFMESESGNKNNVCYTNKGGQTWVADSPIKLFDDEATVYAYFPYNSKAKSLTSVPVYSAVGNTALVLYGHPETLSATAPNWSMVMTPAQALVFVTIRKDNTYLKQGDLSKVSIAAYGIRKSGNLNLKTGDITAAENSGAIEFEEDFGKVYSSGTKLQLNLVTASNSSDRQNSTFSCCIDGVNYSVELTGENGVRYSREITSYVNLVLSEQGLAAESVTSSSEEDTPFLLCKTMGIYKNITPKGMDIVMQYDWKNDQLAFEKGVNYVTCQIFNVELNTHYTFKVSASNPQKGDNVTLTTNNGTETVQVAGVSSSFIHLVNTQNNYGYILAIGE